MKVFLLTLSLFLSFLFKARCQNELTISGSFPKKAGNLVVLTGQSGHIIKAIHTTAAGSFSETVLLDPGYYNLNNTTVYLEPGMNVNIDGSDTETMFTGKGSAENIAFIQLSVLIEKYLPVEKQGTFSKTLSNEISSVSPEDFLKMTESYKANAMDILNGQQLSSFFKTTQKQYIDYVARYYTNIYISKYGLDPERQKAYFKLSADMRQGTIPNNGPRLRAAADSMYVKKLDSVTRATFKQMVWGGFDLDNEDVYKFSPEYRSLIDEWLRQLLNEDWAQARRSGAKPESINLDMVNSKIKNNYIKQELLYQYTFSALHFNTDIEKYYTEYISAATDKTYIERIKNSYNGIKLSAPGLPAPDFMYKDNNDNRFALSSFRGHYVYIYVWGLSMSLTTSEMQPFNSLCKKYEGKNIKFIGLSTDRDIAKWKDYVTNNNPAGIQLIVDNGFQSDFLKNLGISSFPHFILIDPDGKIVAGNADRPAKPALQGLLDKLLTKN